MSKSPVSEVSVYPQKTGATLGLFIYITNGQRRVLLLVSLLIIRLADVTFYENE